MSLGRTLYRELLRWATRAADTPFELRRSHLQEALPPDTFRLLAQKSPHAVFKNGEGVRALAQLSFRATQLSQAEEPNEALDRAFTALRLLNSGYAAEIEERRRQRAARSQRDGVSFSIGQIVYHTRYRYKGVVYGWDAECQRSPEWARQVSVQHDQPFFHILPDEQDCQRLFGSARSTKYVAQSSLTLVADDEQPPRIVHRAIANFFEGYSPSRRRYLGRPQLRFEYPLDSVSTEEDVQSVAEDSNLLLHPEDLGAKAEPDTGPAVVKVEILR